MSDGALFDVTEFEVNRAGDDAPFLMANIHLGGPEDLRAFGQAIGFALSEHAEVVSFTGVLRHGAPPAPPEPAPERDMFGRYSEEWRNHWDGMPHFEQRDEKPWKTIRFALRDAHERERLESTVLRAPLYHGKWSWYPFRPYGRWATMRWGGPCVQPRHPVYVPSKGRWATPLTIRTLQGLGIEFYVVVEEPEVPHYEKVADNLLVLPFRDRGLVAARNWIWDHAEASGARRFWTFDDNIDGIYRLHENVKRRVTSAAPLLAIEDWVDRYANVAVAGMQYEFFAQRRQRYPAFQANTRVYSNMLIDLEAADPAGRKYRNEGFYNDDTDLCLRMLKDGWCTVLFYAFVINKIATMRVSGGMTPHYQGDGRLRMAEELVRRHPDVTKVVHKWGRAQHHVDYSRFKRNVLMLKDGATWEEGVNDYGMELVPADEAEALPPGDAVEMEDAQEPGVRVSHEDNPDEPGALYPLTALAREVTEVNVASGLDPVTPEAWEEARVIPALLAGLQSEVAEALHAWRDDNPDDFAEELADVVIRTLYIAHGLGINLDDEVYAKVAHNRERGSRRGERRV